jgi:hypothetical protein
VPFDVHTALCLPQTLQNLGHDETAGDEIRLFTDQIRERLGLPAGMPLKKSTQTDVSTKLSSAFSEIVDVSDPLDLAAEIEKLTASFCPSESAERFVHNLGLCPAFGILHRCFKRHVVKVERRSYASAPRCIS